jgi:hypothetical protein
MKIRLNYIDIELKEVELKKKTHENIFTCERNSHGLSLFSFDEFSISPKYDSAYYIRITRSYIYLFEMSVKYNMYNINKNLQ